MEDTIAAISTNLSGPAGIGIIRVSGEDAIATADRIFRSPSGKKLADAASHTIHYGKVLDSDGKVCDECLVSVMRAPHTYTREDVAEFNCHGGILVQKKVLSSLIAAGARPAQPGEFTRRAFMNGRIDLSQAEAVMDLINAKNSWAVRASVSQLDGKLSRELEQIRDEILDHTARIEAALDEVNVDRFASYLRNLDSTQFILITHRRGTMEEADVLYGVTMQDEGISKLLELRASEVAAKLGMKAN